MESKEPMEKIGNIILVLLFSIFFVAESALADTSVSARLDRDQLSIGESFNVSVMVKSSDQFEMEEPQFPEVKGIEVINVLPGGRQSSSSMTFINGKSQFTSSVSQDYIFTLSPQKDGDFVIPSIDVKVNGKLYRTNPLKIEVKEEFRNSAKKERRFPPGYGQRNQEDEQSPFSNLPDPNEIFEQLLRERERMFEQFGKNSRGMPNQDQIPSRNLDVNPNEAFFIHLDLSKTEVFEGEQITANWYIYTKANIESLDRAKFPDLKGFWKEIIEEVPTLQFTEEIVNGEVYRKALLASHALFPIKAGSAVVDEFKIKAKLRSRTAMGWGQLRQVNKASKRIEVKVLPLPIDGRTEGFSGAVGNFRVDVKTDGLSFPSHQPFSVKIRFEGIGNAKLIELPNIAWPEGIEVYDVKSESRYFKEGHSFKEFEVLVIPRKEGELTIPQMKFSYFDPIQKKYVLTETNEIKLNITAGEPNSGFEQKSKNQSYEMNAPRFILELPNANFSLLSYKWHFYVLVLIAGVLFQVLYFLREFKLIRIEPEFLNNVKNKQNKIESYLRQKDYRKVGTEATNLIYILVAALAGQKKADLEFHLLIKEISVADRQSFVPTLQNLFDYFQLIGFAPDEIFNITLNSKSVDSQVEMLKNLSLAIVSKIKKDGVYGN